MIDEFMARDPSSYTEEDIKRIVTAYRQQRMKFLQEEEEAKIKGKRAKAPKVQLGSEEKKKLLSDLDGLDI